ncbi:MAG TPA: lytic transglycosylase domain-containing protein [Candidatus Eremiobacteraceae bacterium]|nr:lytic transglycosylase domain-containing protein [Candidatus Eremiobacteraceae bacterium]
MDISPASSIGLDAFSDSDPLANAGAFAGEVGSTQTFEDAIEPSTSNTRVAGPGDRLLEEAQTGVAGLERRFTAFTHLLRRELSTLESRCSVALRSLFGASPIQAQPASNATSESDQTSGAAPPSRFAGIIDASARRNRLDPALLDAVIRQESGFRADVVSGAGAVGLMQLMPGTARELGVSDPFDPAQNVEGGAKYLRSLLDRYDGRLDLALAAYNAGPGAVDHFGGVPPYRETQEYVSSIMAGYRSAVLRAG